MSTLQLSLPRTSLPAELLIRIFELSVERVSDGPSNELRLEQLHRSQHEQRQTQLGHYSVVTPVWTAPARAVMWSMLAFTTPRLYDVLPISVAAFATTSLKVNRYGTAFNVDQFQSFLSQLRGLQTLVVQGGHSVFSLDTLMSPNLCSKDTTCTEVIHLGC